MTVTNELYFAVPGDINTLTGGYTYARQLLTSLQETGQTVRLLVLPAGFPSPDHAALLATDALFNALPDGTLVLVDGLAFGVIPEIALRHSRRLKLIALCHHPLALETGLTPARSHMLQQSEQTALGAAVAIVVTSTMTARVLETHYAVPAAKITVALPGTEPQVFAECNNTVPVLLTVATLTPRKAHDVLIAALHNLGHLPWTARFVGGTEFDTAWAANLHALAASSGVADRICFVGAVADPREEYRYADIFVLPSLYEGYGMVFAEALASGLPVIGTTAGAVPEVVPADSGLLVPPADVAALTDALQRLLTQADLRASLQQGARAAAERLPRWNATARIVAQLINKVTSL